MKRCKDCRDGEHENLDDDVRLVIVIDPDTHKIYRRSYMCDNHRQMHLDDGYELLIKN